jgi:hypothetical protein
VRLLLVVSAVFVGGFTFVACGDEDEAGVPETTDRQTASLAPECSPTCYTSGTVDFGGIDGRIAATPPLPSSLVAVSDFYEFTHKADPPGVQGFSLPLNEGVADPSVIGFYSFIGGQWQRVADVTVTPDGRAEKSNSREPKPTAESQQANL